MRMRRGRSLLIIIWTKSKKAEMERTGKAGTKAKGGDGGGGGGEARSGKETVESTLHEVEEVYVYIPRELSAAGVELKIVGSVRIVNKGGEYHLTWSPSDLSQQSVASLYLAQADSWAMIDEIVEPLEVIDPQFTDPQYNVSSLDAPDPILLSPTAASPKKPSPNEVEVREEEEEEEEAKVTGTGARLMRDGEAHVSGIVTQGLPHGLSPATAERAKQLDTVNFPLSQLHSIRESISNLSPGKRSLTCYLKDGNELPTLHFHDGGTTGLLTAIQRFLYFERDRHDNHLYLVKKFNKNTDKPRQPSVSRTNNPKKAAVEDIVTGVIGGAMGGFIGITRAVRQHFIPDMKLQDVRPGTEEDEDEFAEKIQTVAMSDAILKEEDNKEANPEMSLITDFQLITDIRGKLPPRLSPPPTQPPFSSSEWESLRDGEGRIGPQQEMRFRARVFAGGVEGSMRKEAWRYLLDYFPFNCTDIERMELQQQREREYWTMKTQWQSFTQDQEKQFSKWREAKTLINKDVLRTDRELAAFQDNNNHRLIQLEDILRTYVMYNFDLGYVQGMSDLLAPLLVVMETEVDTFWCFVGYMNMVGHHFEESQEGMRSRLKQLRALLNVTDPQFYQFLKSKETNNLYFCFRWLLIHFKREFDYPVLMRLWEVIWTGYLSPDYALFIALAILEKHRELLFNPAHDFSDILQHVNNLAKKIPLDPVLQLAEILCRQLGACPDLPDDLKCLVIRPLPERFTSLVATETIVCSPEGSAVPSSGDSSAPYYHNEQQKSGSGSVGSNSVPSNDDIVVQLDDAMVAANASNRVVQSSNGTVQAAPNEDSIQSNESYNNQDMFV